MITTIQNTSDAKNIQFKNEFKQKHVQPNTIIMFRTGNTYKVYDEDAIECAKTFCRATENGIFEFSYNLLDVYLPRLIRFGYRIVIADQK